MSNRTDYNGWTNRETWLINVHFEPSSQSDLVYIKEQLEYEVEAFSQTVKFSSFFSDFIDLNRINWFELEQHIQENYEEESFDE